MARRFDVMGVLDATGMNFIVTKITVTATATKLPTTNLPNRKAISVRNNSASVTLYIGGSGVTVATGYPILPYESLPFDMSTGAQLYGICDAGQTVDVRVIEVDNG